MDTDYVVYRHIHMSDTERQNHKTTGIMFANVYVYFRGLSLFCRVKICAAATFIVIVIVVAVVINDDSTSVCVYAHAQRVVHVEKHTLHNRHVHQNEL